MKIVSHSHFWLLLSLAVADSLLFGLTNPGKAPSFMLMIGFLLMTVNLYVVIRGLMRLLSWYGLLPASRRKRSTRLLTAVIAGLVALQSIGQLSVRDMVLLLPIALLAYLYVSYNRSANQSVARSTQAEPQPEAS